MSKTAHETQIFVFGDTVTLSYIFCVTTHKNAVTAAGNYQQSIRDLSDHYFSPSHTEIINTKCLFWGNSSSISSFQKNKKWSTAVVLTDSLTLAEDEDVDSGVAETETNVNFTDLHTLASKRLTLKLPK